MFKNIFLRIIGVIALLTGLAVAFYSVWINIENIVLLQSTANFRIDESLQQSMNQTIICISLGVVSGLLCFMCGLLCTIQKSKTACILISLITIIISGFAVYMLMTSEIDFVHTAVILCLSAIMLISSICSRKISS